MDGGSLLPVVFDNDTSGRMDHVITEHHGHHFPYWQRMIRTHNRKHVFNFTETHEFYDLDEDPWETKNLIDEVDRTELKDMQERLGQWMRETNDPLRGLYNRMIVYT
jgi:hypothetical protein